MGTARDPSAGHGGLAWDTRVWEDSLRVGRFPRISRQPRGMLEGSVVMDEREGPALSLGCLAASPSACASLLVTHLPLCSLPRGFRPFLSIYKCFWLLKVCLLKSTKKPVFLDSG